MFDVNDDQFSVPAPLALLEEMVVTRLTKDAEEREYAEKEAEGTANARRGRRLMKSIREQNDHIIGRGHKKGTYMSVLTWNRLRSSVDESLETAEMFDASVGFQQDIQLSKLVIGLLVCRGYRKENKVPIHHLRCTHPLL